MLLARPKVTTFGAGFNLRPLPCPPAPSTPQESFDAVERSIQAVQADMKVDIKSVEDNLTKLIQPRTAEKEKAGNIWVVHEPTIKVICGSRYDATDRGAVSSRLVSRGHLP